MSLDHLTIDSPAEIHARLQRRYLDRLIQRVRRLRRNLLDRNWEEIRAECRQLHLTADSFGYQEVSILAGRAEKSIPQALGRGEMSKLRPLPEARQAVESLITGIDAILAENAIFSRIN